MQITAFVIGITKFKYEKKNEMDSGRSSKMHHRTNGLLAASSFALIGAIVLKEKTLGTLDAVAQTLNNRMFQIRQKRLRRFSLFGQFGAASSICIS